jgi:hypothetical protein
MKLDKTSGYILGIVSIVALVAIVVMIMNNMGSSFDISGQVVAAATSNTTNCTDTDGGMVYTVKGTVSGGTWGATGAAYSAKTDWCDAKGYLGEFSCNTNTTAYVSYVNCTTVVGPGYYCSSGVCVNTSVATANTTDLIANTSVFAGFVNPGGVVYRMSNGTVISNNVTLNLTIGVKNQGTTVPRGTYYSAQGIQMISELGNTVIPFTQNFFGYITPPAAGSTTMLNAKTYSYSYSEAFLNELYNFGSSVVTWNYYVDDYSRKSGSTYYGVPETNETNNNGTTSVEFESDYITFITVDCRVDADCDSTEYCANYVDYVIYGKTQYSCITKECTTDADCATGCGCSGNSGSRERYTCFDYVGGSTYLTNTTCTY